MKVLRRGKKKPITAKIECGECEALVLVEESELSLNRDQRDGNFYWFVCPECGCKHAVSTELFLRR